MRLLPTILPAALLLACSGSSRGPSTTPTQPAPADQPAATPVAPDAGVADAPDAGPPPGWVVLHEETFESITLPDPEWQVDPVPDDGPFSDQGLYWSKLGVKAPAAYRISAPLGEASWLTAESYTRSNATAFSQLASVVVDPADAANHALRIASPQHTDATVLRPSEPLPARYRVSLRIGFAAFGDGKPGMNGYHAAATAEPWSTADVREQNGFYWLAILDAQPRPHNNTWIHHHRKVVLDSDNNYPAWMEMFDGRSFVYGGERPLMMFALDGGAAGHDLFGKPFLSYSAGAWQPSGAIRAVDSYLPGEWYRASIERNGDLFTLEVSGKFRYGGQQTYRATIDAKANCVFHYNRPGETADPRCIDERSPASLGPGHPNWPAAGSWPDWFMLGDPHANYYEGSVLYDDLRLEVWRD